MTGDIDDEEIARRVADVDELICGPEIEMLLIELAQRTPVDQLDQDAAARAEALREWSTMPGVRRTAGGLASCPAWVRQGLLTAFARWAVGAGNTCPHNPDPDHPQPVHAAAWRAGVVTCSGCSDLLHDDRAVCDGCGGVATFYRVVNVGSFSYRLRVCEGCAY